VIRTADVLSAEIAVDVFKSYAISPTQYNVLRILRGAGGNLACGEIASRMITRDPDITRLLDRLEKRGLISRCRHDSDRRVVATRITDSGLALLSELDPVLDGAHRKQLGHMGPAKLKQLIALLEEARERPDQE